MIPDISVINWSMYDASVCGQSHVCNREMASFTRHSTHLQTWHPQAGKEFSFGLLTKSRQTDILRVLFVGVLCLWWFIEGSKRTRGLRNAIDTNHVLMALVSFLYLPPLSYCCGLEDQKPAAHCLVTARDSKAQGDNGNSPFSTKKGFTEVVSRDTREMGFLASEGKHQLPRDATFIT